MDWNIDVKTEAQFEEMDISAEQKKAVSALFSDLDESEEEITNIGELPGISERIADILKQNGIELIETLITMSEEELTGIEGLTDQDIQSIHAIISENVEIVEEEEPEKITVEDQKTENEVDKEPKAQESEEETEEEDEEEYECPECGSTITLDMTSCPNCGVGLSFEIEESDEEDDA